MIIHQESSALRRSQIDVLVKSNCGFVCTTPDVKECLLQTVTRTLMTWAIGPKATPPEEIVFRQAIHARYCTPYYHKLQYKTQLDIQARCASVQHIKGVSILLFAGVSL